MQAFPGDIQTAPPPAHPPASKTFATYTNKSLNQMKVNSNENFTFSGDPTVSKTLWSTSSFANQFLDSVVHLTSTNLRV
jgi:hypothetical protein